MYQNNVAPIAFAPSQGSSARAFAMGVTGTLISFVVGPILIVLIGIVTDQVFWALFFGPLVVGAAGLVLGILAMALIRKGETVGRVATATTFGVISIVGGSIGLTFFLFYLMIFASMWATK